jgi:hypothetical protein
MTSTYRTGLMRHRNNRPSDPLMAHDWTPTPKNQRSGQYWLVPSTMAIQPIREPSTAGYFKDYERLQFTFLQQNPYLYVLALIHLTSTIGSSDNRYDDSRSKSLSAAWCRIQVAKPLPKWVSKLLVVPRVTAERQPTAQGPFSGILCPAITRFVVCFYSAI